MPESSFRACEAVLSLTLTPDDVHARDEAYPPPGR
jgi:hypothetical protein